MPHNIPSDFFPSENLQKRFWQLVDKRLPDECWPWIGYKTKKGYGIIIDNGVKRRAHRVAWMISSGVRVPPMALIIHKCLGGGNPWCCNPKHLKAGTQSDNMEDMKLWNRVLRGDLHPARLHPENLARGDRHGLRLHPEKVPHMTGESHGMAKLTDESVKEIRHSYANGGCSQRTLSKIYGCSQSMISYIVTKRNWTHLG